MPYNRSYSRGRTRSSTNTATNATVGQRRQYTKPSTAIRRHDFQTINRDSVAPILPNEYVVTTLAKFQRTFGSGDDEPDSALTSNNFPNPQTMNGSYISNFKSKIRMQNRDDGKGIYLDVYSIAISFYDALVWDTVYPSACPVTFSTDNTTPSNAGEVSFKAVTDSLVTDVQYKAFKGVQHYMRKLGSVYLTSEDSSQNYHDLILTGLPAKCRRSNLGMLYAIVIQNDAIKNDNASAQVTITTDTSYVETPSEERLPWQP